tara:strand:+ start:2275 stop:4854 length:2580 start_codon:yes stop_codon:yes gene_type:complete
MKNFFLLTIFFSFLLAQHNHSHDEFTRCATDELEQELQLLNPDFIAKRDAQILKAQELIRDNPQWRTSNNSQNTIFVPVIFHVLYYSATDNISAFRIGENFNQINLDFQNINPDGDEIPSAPNPSNAPYDPGVDYSHQAVRGTHNVVFVGALGESTGSQLIEGTTILRYQINTSSVSGVGNASDLAGSIEPDQSTWPVNPNTQLSGGYKDGYLNIYIAPLTGGLLGQAYLGFPESVVLGGSVGSVENPGTAGGYNRGRTLTHELGHNFTFSHVFNSNGCGNSLWSDIPAQTVNNRAADIYEWPTGSGNFYGRGAENSCISSTGKGDQFMNYMDYVYDDQMRMFSVQQALDGYAWAASRNWAQVVNGVITQITSDVNYATSDREFTINVTFDEVVTGFTEEDIVLENATIVNFNAGDGSTYSFDVQAIVDGEVEISIGRDSCVGVNSGEGNLGSNKLVVIVDTSAPEIGTFNIGNIQDTFYITSQYPGLNLVLKNFEDDVSGISNYYVSVGLSPTGQEIYPATAFSSTFISIPPSELSSLSDFQQYYVNVFARNFVGLDSEVVSNSFYYFGSLIGDHDGDWDIDFVDYAYFISNYPGIDIAPVTGSAPYFFPNFDGISDDKDLNMFESQWNWSLAQQTIRDEPNYTEQSGPGERPSLNLVNEQLVVRFDPDASTSQFYLKYSPDEYAINYLSSNLNNYIILNGNDADRGIIQMEVADYSFNRSTPIEITFSFENNTDSYDFLEYNFSTYNKTNQIVAEGYDYLQTAPSNYRLAQSYPNPFTSGGTTIEFDLPVTDTVTMFILDIRGRKVRTLINKEQLFGYQSVMWDAKNDDGEMVSSGVYFYQIKSRNFNEVGKLVFVK